MLLLSRSLLLLLAAAAATGSFSSSLPSCCLFAAAQPRPIPSRRRPSRLLLVLSFHPSDIICTDTGSTRKSSRRSRPGGNKLKRIGTFPNNPSLKTKSSSIDVSIASCDLPMPSDYNPSSILSKYGLQQQQHHDAVVSTTTTRSLLLRSTPKTTLLPGSHKARIRSHIRTFISKVIQLASITLASRLTQNRIRLGVNIVRWVVFTLLLAFGRWYGRLVASTPSEWSRDCGGNIDELGFIRERYRLVGEDTTINKDKYIVRRTPGDGSCLCYALAAALLHSEAKKSLHGGSDCRDCSDGIVPTKSSWSDIRRRASELRTKAVDILENGGNATLFISGEDVILTSDLLSATAASFGMSAKDYCHTMRMPSCWGGGPEIVALGNVLKRPIWMYEVCSYDRSSTTIQSPDNASKRFALRRTICFGPSVCDDIGESLHILLADSQFPAAATIVSAQGQSKSERGHFLALFPISD